MVDSALGEKRVCPECAAKFYDMNKKPAVCPKCGTSFTPQAAPKPSIPGKKKPVSKAKPKPQPTFDEAPEGDFKDDEDLSEALEEMDEGEIESIAELEDREVTEDRVNSDDVDDDVLIDEVEPDEKFVEEIEEDEDEEKE